MRAVRAAVGVVRKFWIDHLWVDVVIAAAFVAAHVGLVFVAPVLDVFGRALPADRRGVYSSAAVVVSLLGTLSALAIGQLGSAGGSRAKALRDQAAGELAYNWRSTFRAGLLAALVSILALLLDPSVHVVSLVPVVVRWTFESVLIFAVVKFFRLSALFFEVLSIKALSEADAAEEQESEPAPKLGSRWQRTAA